jgi:hypothetical protein
MMPVHVQQALGEGRMVWRRHRNHCGTKRLVGVCMQELREGVGKFHKCCLQLTCTAAQCGRLDLCEAMSRAPLASQ